MRAAWAVLELCTTVNRLGDVSYATQLVDREDGGYFLPGGDRLFAEMESVLQV